jgi:hypothetical protein
MIAELVVDGDADNIPKHLSEEDYKMFIDCQSVSVNAEGLAPLCKGTLYIRFEIL